MNKEQLKKAACMECRLIAPQCDGNDKDGNGKPCKFVQIERRTDYFREYYQANREKKIAAAKARNEVNRQQYLTYQAEYRANHPNRAT